MSRRSSLPRQLAVVLIALVVLAGCRSPESAAKAYLTNGDRFFAERKFAEAVIEYRNAIQRVPTMSEAHFKLGEALAAQSDVVGALGAYVRAADLNPELLDAQLKAADLLLLARRYDDARIRLRAVLSKQPDHSQALMMLGAAMAGLGSLDEALAANRRAIALDPKRAGTYINLGAFQYKQGQRKEAESTLKAAIAAEPKSVTAHVALGDYYALENRLADAERTYKDALALDPANLEANRAVSEFYLTTGRLREAEPYLARVAEKSRRREDIFALVDYYMATGRRPVALRILQGLRARPESYADATVKMALLATIDRRPAQAMRLLDEVLAKQPTNANALALKTHVLLGNRRRVEALQTAEAAVKADPKSEAAQFAHAAAARAMGQREDAKNAYLEAVKLNPRSAEALIELAQLHLDQNLVDTALQYADQAVRVSPDLVEAKLMRVRVMANSSALHEEAAREVALLLTRYPKSPEVKYEAGLAALSRGDTAAAYRYFEHARQLAPDYTRPLIELIKLDLKAARPALARQRADDELRKAPDSIELLLIAGNTHAMVDPSAAERLLRKVLELDASNITAYQSLATLFLAQGRLDKARQEFVHLTEQQPTNVAPPTMVGIICEAQRDPAQAEQWYQRALKINGRAAAAANNLAWMYAEQGRNLEAAVELAQIARGELPRQAEVIDTLGWAYLRKGLIAQAVRTLQDAVNQAPDVALYHYHLGLAYAQTGEDARARISLQQALKLDPKFSNAVDAQRALAKLLY
ncbi:MAG: tetratricopeptide repeat protein [Acidobacteria bacterium]|nr:tetratricopeptide repeat protein [Acidobacteriota bacterium]